MYWESANSLPLMKIGINLAVENSSRKLKDQISIRKIIRVNIPFNIDFKRGFGSTLYLHDRQFLG